MAATIQIMVAGGLLLAWIWVLGRPLLNGAVGRSDYRDLSRSYLDQTGIDSEAAASPKPEHKPRGPRFGGAVVGWWRGPIEVRRRQLMLASMFASFASFLMAIALRDKFLYLFLMMATVLVVQLIVASHVGGRINEVRRSVVVTNAKDRVRSQAEPQGMRIRAARVQATSFDRVNELVSMLAESDEAKAEPIGVTSYVSDLIDQEWGEVERAAAESPASTRVRLEGDETQAEAKPEVVETAVVETDVVVEAAAVEAETVAAETDVAVETGVASDADGAVEAEADSDESASEPIFTRAVKDVPARSRRQAQPIYIESQLDGDDDFSQAKAVNHP